MEPVLSKPPAKRKRSPVIYIGVALLAVFGVCTIVFLLLFRSEVAETPIIKEQISHFLTYTSNGEYTDAYALTNEGFKKEVSFDDFTYAMDEYPALYTDFQSLTQTGFNIQKDVGRPSIYEFSGTIHYATGDSGSIEVILRDINGEWLIQHLYINVSQERLDSFDQQSRDAVLGTQDL